MIENSCRDMERNGKNHWGLFLEIRRHFVYFLVPTLTFIFSCLMLSKQSIDTL